MTNEVKPEQIAELRNQFAVKLAKDGPPASVGGTFHQMDLDRIHKNDNWLRLFLDHNDLDMKESLKQLWDTCEWRKKFGTNEISEENVRVEYLKDGLFFPHSRDVDGKVLLIFKTKMYTKGSKNMDDLKRCLVYWVERIIREEKGDTFTVVFDMANTGLSNMDMDYTKYIINLLKFYYPSSLNYILIYEMPWILNATFQIIKKLLPAKAVARMKFLNSKNMKEFINPENMLTCWGGQDEYVFSFVPEVRDSNNNDPDTENVMPTTNQVNKKVHFANLSPPESPMSDIMNVNFRDGEGEYLRIKPQNSINFTKSGNELVGSVEILNIDLNPVTYKIKTTAPEKFRVRPSTGVLSPGATTTINVVLVQGQQVVTLSREKFLVMCTCLGSDLSTNTQDLTEFWKTVPLNSSAVEQYRLKCVLSVSASSDELVKYGSFYNNNSSTNDIDSKQITHFQSTLSQLADTTHRLESQVKFNQTLQWITIGVCLLFSIAIVYILKIDIKDSSTQYCVKK